MTNEKFTARFEQFIKEFCENEHAYEFLWGAGLMLTMKTLTDPNSNPDSPTTKLAKLFREKSATMLDELTETK